MAEKRRLVHKIELLERTGLSYPTLWKLMRKGQFPRSRVISTGKVVWMDSEIEAWFDALPVRRLKGDPTETGS